MMRKGDWRSQALGLCFCEASGSLESGIVESKVTLPIGLCLSSITSLPIQFVYPFLLFFFSLYWEMSPLTTYGVFQWWCFISTQKFHVSLTLRWGFFWAHPLLSCLKLHNISRSCVFLILESLTPHLLVLLSSSSVSTYLTWVLWLSIAWWNWWFRGDVRWIGVDDCLRIIMARARK